MAWFSQNRWYDEFNRLLFMLKILCCRCSLFGFNIPFNNFSVISRRCLVATGSSTLTFIVLPHWSMHQTLDMIQHLITWFWHWVDQYKLYPVSLSARRSAASTIFYDFDMLRPGSELVTSHSPKQTLYRATGAGKRYYTQVIIDENIL